MKKAVLVFCLLVMALGCGAQRAQAQGSASRGPDPSTVRDAELEKESMHNLEVARHYFKLKKAYRAALARCEEIIAANPNFAGMAETLYIAGESSLLLADGKGKQGRPRDVKPEALRDNARDYLSRLVKEFPDSPFREQAEADLNSLGGPKKTVDSSQ